MLTVRPLRRPTLARLVPLVTHQSLARICALLAVALVGGMLAWSYAQDGIVFELLNGESTAEQKVAALRSFVENFGAAAPLVYAGFVTAEVVVAPLPGTMLYAPGGLIFGGFWGGALSLAGNVLGAGIACQLMRLIAGNHAERFVARSALAPYEDKISERGAWVVFLLRVNPLTSSDLVSYAAGLTHVSVWQVMVGTLAGMAPLCFGQAYLAEGLFAAFPRLLYPLLAACAVYALVVVWILARLWRSPQLHGEEMTS